MIQKPFVKGMHMPTLNTCQQSLLDLFIEEHDHGYMVERIDKVEVINDYNLRIFTSQFTPLETQGTSFPSRHLQMMSTYIMWDEDPSGDLVMQDPYCELDRDRTYREVVLSSVYRTLEGDEGWVATVSPTTYVPDSSPLHIWEG